MKGSNCRANPKLFVHVPLTAVWSLLNVGLMWEEISILFLSNPLGTLFNDSVIWAWPTASYRSHCKQRLLYQECTPAYQLVWALTRADCLSDTQPFIFQEYYHEFRSSMENFSAKWPSWIRWELLSRSHNHHNSLQPHNLNKISTKQNKRIYFLVEDAMKSSGKSLSLFLSLSQPLSLFLSLSLSLFLSLSLYPCLSLSLPISVCLSLSVSPSLSPFLCVPLSLSSSFSLSLPCLSFSLSILIQTPFLAGSSRFPLRGWVSLQFLSTDGGWLCVLGER